MLENLNLRWASGSTNALMHEGLSRCWYRAVSLLFLLCLTVPGLILTGCGGNFSSHAKAGTIVFSNSGNSSAQVTVLAIASTVKLSMMPTGDSNNGGVDWVVACGGNPVTGSITNGACGTLSPAHTSDGQPTTYKSPSVIPIGASITITATVTSNPSQSSSVSLTIVPMSIGISFSGVIPGSLPVNTMLPLAAKVINDPLNAGVAFTATCGSSACGSFNPAISGGSSEYTAPSEIPAGNTVTITATSLTDTSKSVSATLTITTPSVPPPVTVSVVPVSLYAQPSGSAHIGHLTAIVGNDPQTAGVDWSVSCAAQACGSITPHTDSGVVAMYAAPSDVPPGGTVSITAKSTTNPAAYASATASIVTVTPIVVSISSAPPLSLIAGTQSALAATTTGDTDNLGVDWTANCGSAGACGSFNLSPAHTASTEQIIYTAPTTVPSGGLVTITASSSASSPSNPGIAFTTIVQQPPSVSFLQAPPSAITSATQASVSAAVANDVSPGGVNWTVQCGSTIPGGCGWITPPQTASGAKATYNAPPVTSTGTTVTMTASSIADPSAIVSSSPIVIYPSTALSVSFIPTLPSQVQPNATLNLSAAVANDSANAGIDWQVCASGCGFFTIRPAIPAIPATPTTPYVPAVPAVMATSVSGWSNGLPIPYTAPLEAPSSGNVAILAMAHADHAKATSGAIAISDTPNGPALHGLVLAGVQPVAGASVSLYTAGISGYASAAASVGTAITDKNGNFTIAGTYSCTSPSSQMYLVATRGKVGTNNANPNLALMTALGNCSNLSSAPVVLNEITTVAAAYATGPFAANDALAGNNSYLYLGTSGGNSTGLANAFATANSLVDITTGQARFFVPAGNAAAPYVPINTVADMLNACTATSGGVEGDGSACGSLFTGTDILPQHSLYNSVAPTDTLQAAFNIAQHPVSNFGYSLSLPNLGDPSSLASSNSPFQPILSATPNDWSLSLNYTIAGLPAADTLGSFAMDAGGNLWITDATAGKVIEWNSTGATISPAAGYPAGGGPIAIDAAGNVWTSGNGSLNELTNLGIPELGSPFAGVAGGGSDMAVDAQDNLWITNGAGVSEFSNLGVQLSPASGFTNTGISGITAVDIDSANNVWLGAQNSAASGAFSELTNPGGQLIVSSSLTLDTVLPELAADGAGGMWGIAGINLCHVPPYGGEGSILVPTCYVEDVNSGTSGVLPFYNAQGLAMDGAGTLWVASKGGGSVPIAPSVLPIVSGNVSSNAGTYYVSPSLAAGPLRVGVDDSGNVWVLLADNTLTEYISAAAPTVNPTALALKTKKLGAKP